MERRLSAILAADIVGYSAQMERDEAGTFARVTARRRDIFEPEIARHQGRIFKVMGDGILAEFASVVQAVECAMSIQTALAERNRSVPEDQAIRARIGINLGEVIIDGDDRYGEGVNIAARLEGLADPGGICVSDKVAREVEKKLAFGFESMGERRVKNIAEPIHVYRVNATPVTAIRSTGPRRASRRLIALVAALVVAVGGGAFWLRPLPGPDGPPVLEVAPFVAAPGTDDVADAITSNLIEVLATSPDLRVVRALDAEHDTADATPPDYLLEGQLSVGDPYHAFTFRLLDGASRAPLWSGTREFAPAELATESARIGARIYSSLVGSRGEILRLEEQRTRGIARASTAYGAHLQGLVAFMEGNEAGYARAEEVWRAGLTDHPGSAQLMLDLALVAFRRATTMPADMAAAEVRAAWLLVNDAAAVPTPSRRDVWMIHYLRSVLLPPMLGDFKTAMSEAKAAFALVPHNPMANLDMAQMWANSGQALIAVEWAESAVEIEVNPPDWYREAMAWVYVSADRLDEALAIYQGLDDPLRPEHALTLMLLVQESESRAMFEAIDAARGEGASEAALTLGLGGRHPRGTGRTQTVVEFGILKLNQGKPRKPVQVVEGSVSPDTSGRKASATLRTGKAARLKASLSGTEDFFDGSRTPSQNPVEVDAMLAPEPGPVPASPTLTIPRLHALTGQRMRVVGVDVTPP